MDQEKSYKLPGANVRVILSLHVGENKLLQNFILQKKDLGIVVKKLRSVPCNDKR